MVVKINGKSEQIDRGLTVISVLKSKNIRPEMVAIEINGSIVEREDYGTTVLKEGDEVEYLYYMGGGECKTD